MRHRPLFTHILHSRALSLFFPSAAVFSYNVSRTLTNLNGYSISLLLFIYLKISRDAISPLSTLISLKHTFLSLHYCSPRSLLADSKNFSTILLSLQAIPISKRALPQKHRHTHARSLTLTLQTNSVPLELNFLCRNELLSRNNLSLSLSSHQNRLSFSTKTLSLTHTLSLSLSVATTTLSKHSLSSHQTILLHFLKNTFSFFHLRYNRGLSTFTLL